MNKKAIIKLILNISLNNLEFLFDFENTTEKEFKEIYGISKKELKEVLRE